MAIQLVTRVPDELAEAVDELVRAGVFGSRSDVVRAGLTAVIDQRRRLAIGEAIADGYRRVPQAADADDLAWSDAATAAMIGDEPW